MKQLKAKYVIFILAIMLMILPFKVYAGITWGSHESIDSNKYKFVISFSGTSNYLKGKINVTNATITEVTMKNSWIKGKVDADGTFVFYHNGVSTGSGDVAEVEVTMTASSGYSIENPQFGVYKCIKTDDNKYFDKDGNIVDDGAYTTLCTEPEKSNDATLKSLAISPGNLTPTFNSDIYSYNATVENSVDKISISATPNNENAQITSENTCQLQVGANTCNIAVEAENGNSLTYEINVTRKSVESPSLSQDTTITNLQVHNATLQETFSPTLYNYNISVSKNTESVYFTYTLVSNNQNYRSEECKLTDNIKSCTLIVTAEDGVTKVSYIFNINWNDGTVTPSDSNSNANTNTATDTNNNSNNKEANDIPENPQTGLFINIIVLLVATASAIGIIIWSKKRNKFYKI